MGVYQYNALIQTLAVFVAATSVLNAPAVGQVNDPRFLRFLGHPLAAQSPAGAGPEQTPAAIPKSPSSAKLTAVGSFKTLWAALESSGLAATLAGAGPFTVFAPTDQAFAALPQGTFAELLKPENKAVLVKILTYHVVPATVNASALKPGALQTVEGHPIQIGVDPANNQVKVNTAKVILPNVQASNGVIHVIDRVILPPDILDQPKEK